MFVYIWKKTDGTPFYVGMSKTRNRTDPTKAGGRGWLCKRTLAEVGRSFVVAEVIPVPDLPSAQAMERHLIAQYGCEKFGTGPLTNLRCGGEGGEGMSVVGRASLSAFLKENNPMHRREVREKVRVALTSDANLQRMRGENNPSKSAAARAKIKALWADPEWRTKMLSARAKNKAM